MISTIDLTRNTTDRFFIDSNVLVYSYDSADPDKRSVAQQLIADLVGNRNGFISVQVLGEFFVSVTRRIQNPLSIKEAAAAVDLLGTLPVIDIDSMMVRRAIVTHGRYGTTYWDSLIIAAAERAGCTSILSEDMNTGQSYHGILAVNPFASEPP